MTGNIWTRCWMVGITPGAELTFEKDPSITAVIDDKRIEFEGERLACRDCRLWRSSIDWATLGRPSPGQTAGGSKEKPYRSGDDAWRKRDNRPKGNMTCSPTSGIYFEGDIETSAVATTTTQVGRISCSTVRARATQFVTVCDLRPEEVGANPPHRVRAISAIAHCDFRRISNRFLPIVAATVSARGKADILSAPHRCSLLAEAV